MAAHKNKTPTDTLTVRFPQAVVDKIRARAREQKITMQQYFMNQMSPEAEIWSFIMESNKEGLEKSIYNHQARMLEDISGMARMSGISDEEMRNYLEKGMQMLMRGESIEDIKNEFEKKK